jgi:hypothetical protein
MRCPDCNKFVAMESADPEVSLEVEYTPSHDADNKPIHEFMVTGSVRIVRNCAECGNELKEANFDVEQAVEFGEDVGAAVDVADFKEEDLESADVEETSSEATEEGGGRYAKSYYGAYIQFDVRVGGKVVASGEWSDKVAASGMDELV